MNSKAPFVLAGRNPDVLTSIANLSSDEVFTPPSFANQMLDNLEQSWAASNNGKSIWENSSVTFLDPATKSGVFLREITRRLVDGLSQEIPDLQERVNHVLTKQVFGIATTELTSLLARRSVYCSKAANNKHSICTAFSAKPDGHVLYERIEHVWSVGKSREIQIDEDANEVEVTVDGKCSYCGANQRDYGRTSLDENHAYAFIHTTDPAAMLRETFGVKVKFDVVIGNPPYQLGKSGGEAIGGFAMPIYQKFVESAKKLDPRFISFVIPSRWFAGGRGLDDFRKEMLSDSHLETLVDYPDAGEVFSGTPPKGGVSYFLWNQAWSGPCEISTVEKGEVVSPPMRRYLSDYDVLIRRNESIPILEKVLAVSRAKGFDSIADSVSSIQPFSLRTNFKGSATSVGLKDPVKLFNNGGTSFIERNDVPRNEEWVDEWKVLLGAAYGAGDSYPHQIFNYPIVAGPGTACTETYLVIKRFSSEEEAILFAAYLRTKFVRFLVSLRKNTQHLYSERFKFVPELPLDREWDDQGLAKEFGLNSDDLAFIDSMIRPMEVMGE